MELENKPLIDLILSRINIESGVKPERIKSISADEDGIIYSTATIKEEKKGFQVDVSVPFAKCYTIINVNESMKKIYQNLMIDATTGNNFSFFLPLEEDKEKMKENLRIIGDFRKNLYACILQPFYDAANGRKTMEKLQINIKKHYSIVFEAYDQKVTVTYIFSFCDQEDIIIGKIFLQEFAESKRSISSAPSARVTYKPPKEVEGIPRPPPSNVDAIYLTLVLSENHISGSNQKKTTEAIQTLMPFLKNHLKYSKAYLHSRMRRSTDEQVKLIKRSRPDCKISDKKISGRANR